MIYAHLRCGRDESCTMLVRVCCRTLTVHTYVVYMHINVGLNGTTIKFA